MPGLPSIPPGLRFIAMKLRLRYFGAVLALVALTAYFAEGLWASMCPPEMPMAGVEEVVGEEEPQPACPMEMGLASSDTSEPVEQPGPQAPTCPLGPLGVSGSCVAASLPATTTQMAPSLPEDAQLSLPPDSARDLLLATPFFHPPKA